MTKSLKSKGIIKISIIVLAVAAVGGGCYYGFSKWRGARMATAMASMQSAGPPFQRASTQEISEFVSASGVVKLHKEESVYAITKELISEVLVEVGDKVEKDQVIVLYDIEDKRAALEKQINQTELNISNQNLTLRNMTVPASESTMKQLRTSVDNADKSLFDARSSVTSTELKISDQESAISRAKESYETAQDSIDKAERSIEKALDNVAKAQQKVTDAEDELAKQKQLLDVGGISQEEYKKYEDAVDTAKDGVKTAEDSLDNAKDSKKSAEESKKQAGYSVDNAENSLRDLRLSLETNNNNVSAAQKSLSTAQSNLSDASVVLKDESDRISYEKQQNSISLLELDLADYKKQLDDLEENAVSPMNGTITSVNAAKGKSVDTSTVLVTIANFGDLIVTSNISEHDIPKLQVGQAASMTSEGLEGVEYKGKVTKISDSAVTQNATSGSETVVPVEISFEAPVSSLKPGFNLDLEILVGHNPTAVTVPITALQKDEGSGGYNVFVVNDDDRTVKMIQVVKGITDDLVVEVVSGLSEGDQVITSPTVDMYDGMPIEEIGASRVRAPSGSNGFMIGGNRPGGMMGGNGTRPSGGSNGGTSARPSGGSGGSRPSGGGGVIVAP